MPNATLSGLHWQLIMKTKGECWYFWIGVLITCNSLEQMLENTDNRICKWNWVFILCQWSVAALLLPDWDAPEGLLSLFIAPWKWRGQNRLWAAAKILESSLPGQSLDDLFLYILERMNGFNLELMMKRYVFLFIMASLQEGKNNFTDSSLPHFQSQCSITIADRLKWIY